MKFKNLLTIGVDDSLESDKKRRIIFSNVVFLVILGIMTILVGINMKFYVTRGITTFSQSLTLDVFFVVIICLLLNYFRYYLAARLLFMVSWILFVTIIPPIIVGKITIGAYFSHSSYCIASCTIAHLLFSFQKERAIYLSFFIFSAVLSVFSYDYLLYFDTEPGRIEEIITPFVLRLRGLVFSLFFNFILIYILRINWQFDLSLQKRNEIILVQNKLLDEQQARLKQYNTELEARVDERTSELVERNKQLTEYAFFHAHILRAPVSRIRGLLNLLSMPISPQEEKKIRGYLGESMNDLDTAIKSVSDKLNEPLK